MKDLMIISVTNKYAIICMADHVNKDNMWNNVVGHIEIHANKRLCDVELSGENLGRVKYFSDAIPMLENKTGIKCQYTLANNM